MRGGSGEVRTEYFAFFRTSLYQLEMRWGVLSRRIYELKRTHLLKPFFRCVFKLLRGRRCTTLGDYRFRGPLREEGFVDLAVECRQGGGTLGLRKHAHERLEEDELVGFSP